LSAPRPRTLSIAKFVGRQASPACGIIWRKQRSGSNEIAGKDLRAISIALVDDQQIAWARGFGRADLDQGAAATAETVYRVDSVSKLFTEIGKMQLVERGELDLDAPLQTYLTLSPTIHSTNQYLGG